MIEQQVICNDGDELVGLIAAAIRAALDGAAKIARERAEGWTSVASSDVVRLPQPPPTPKELVEARAAEARGLAAAIEALKT